MSSSRDNRYTPVNINNTMNRKSVTKTRISICVVPRPSLRFSNNKNYTMWIHVCHECVSESAKILQNKANASHDQPVPSALHIL